MWMELIADILGVFDIGVRNSMDGVGIEAASGKSLLYRLHSS